MHQGENGDVGNCYVSANGKHVGLDSRKLKIWASAIVSSFHYIWNLYWHWHFRPLLMLPRTSHRTRLTLMVYVMDDSLQVSHVVILCVHKRFLQHPAITPAHYWWQPCSLCLQILCRSALVHCPLLAKVCRPPLVIQRQCLCLFRHFPDKDPNFMHALVTS